MTPYQKIIQAANEGTGLYLSVAELAANDDADAASDNCRPDGAPILCHAEYRPDKMDEYANTENCILAFGHRSKLHKTWSGKTF